jgi:hypothetical protein
VDVVADLLHSLVISPTSITLPIYAEQQFGATGYDLYGNVVTCMPLSWQVDVQDAGSIDATGVFTAGNNAGRYEDVVAISSGLVGDTADVVVIWPHNAYLAAITR